MTEGLSERREVAMRWEDFDAAAFYEDVARKYPEAALVYSTLEGRLRRRFVQRFLKAQSGTLLDVGCNVGIHMEDYPGPRIGVDIAPSLVNTARKRMPDAVFHVGSAEAMTFLSDESVDVLLCTEVLEHLERPQSALNEFHRVMRNGGRVLVTTPNRLSNDQEDWIDADVLCDYGIDQPKYFHTAYTPGQLADMVSSTGLVVEEQGSFAHEVAYCHSVTYPFYDFASRVNRRLFGSRRLEYIMRRGYFLLQRGAYGAVCISGLRRYFNSHMPEGKFTFVVARKASS